MSYFKAFFRYQFAPRQCFFRLTSNTLTMQKRRFSINSGTHEGVDEFGNPPLHNGELERVKQLIDAGTDVNSKMKSGLTSLHAALLNGHVECMKLLIKSGADVNSKEKDELTPLHLASYHGRYKCVKLLVKAGADVNTTDKDGNTPLMSAARDEVDKFRRSTEICVELLLHEGVEINIINKNNENALLVHMKNKASRNRDYKRSDHRGASCCWGDLQVLIFGGTSTYKS